jgi:hypothetical protein
LARPVHDSRGALGTGDDVERQRRFRAQHVDFKKIELGRNENSYRVPTFARLHLDQEILEKLSNKTS